MPRFQYDMLVLGGGAAGLSAASIAQALGLRTALVEGKQTGGECTWQGCVPSKALIASARLAHEARHAAAFGLHIDTVQVDIAAVMARLRSISEAIYAEESPAVLRAQGMDVYEQFAHFVDPHTLELNDGTRLSARRILLCTGAQTLIPAGFPRELILTNEDVFALTALPTHLIVIGGGALGVEMAQAFRRLGSAVTLITELDRLLPRDDPAASAHIAAVLQAEGVTLRFGQRAEQVRGQIGALEVLLHDGQAVQGSHVLLGVGKRADIRPLRPEAAGIAIHPDGRPILRETLQTSQAHIYAAGDVAGPPFATHVAGSRAFAAVANSLFPILGMKALNPLPIHATYSEPEVAHVGLTEAEARHRYGAGVHITQRPFGRADRARTEGHPEGFIKLVHGRYGKLYGVTLVGHNAAEMLNEWLPLVQGGQRTYRMALLPHVYPTLGSTNRIIALEQLQTLAAERRLGAWVRRIVAFWARLR